MTGTRLVYGWNAKGTKGYELRKEGTRTQWYSLTRTSRTEEATRKPISEAQVPATLLRQADEVTAL